MMKIEQIGWREVQGTGFQGYLEASYDDLVAAFGRPQPGSSDGKTRLCWRVRLEGEVIANIYDYKCTVPLYLMGEWNVGGRGPLALKLVKEAVRLANRL